MNQRINPRQLLLCGSALFSIYIFYLLVKLATYQMPTSDDYCHTNSIQNSSYYYTWSIPYRFLYDLLLNISFQFSSLNNLQFFYVSYICIFLFIITLFVSSLYIFPKKSMNYLQRVIVLAPFLCGALYILDDLNVHKEVIFWFSASLLHGLGYSLCFLWILIIFKQRQTRNLIHLLLLFLFSFIIGGSQEQVCLSVGTILFLHFIFYYKHLNENDKRIIIVSFLGIFLGVIFSIFGGFKGRFSHMEGGSDVKNNFFFLLLQNLYNILEFILKNNPAKVKFLIFGLIAFVIVNPFWFLKKEQIEKIVNQDKLNFKIFALFIGGFVSLAPLSAIFGGLPDSRSFHFYDFFFYLASILLLIKLSYKIKPYLFSKIPEFESFSNFLGFFVWFYLLFQASLFFQKEIKFGKKLYEQYEARHNFLKSYYGQKDITLFVPYLQAQKNEIPRLLYYRDLYPQNHWTNGCMSEYYKVKYIYPSEKLPLGKFGYKKD